MGECVLPCAPMNPSVCVDAREDGGPPFLTEERVWNTALGACMHVCVCVCIHAYKHTDTRVTVSTHVSSRFTPLVLPPLTRRSILRVQWWNPVAEVLPECGSTRRGGSSAPAPSHVQYPPGWTKMLDPCTETLAGAQWIPGGSRSHRMGLPEEDNPPTHHASGLSLPSSSSSSSSSSPSFSAAAAAATPQ